MWTRSLEDVLQFVSIKNKNIDQKVNLNVIVDIIRIRNKPYSKIHIGKVSYDDLPTIKANNQHINLLFTELIENGFKFKNITNPEVKIKYAESKSEHMIDIVDNGIGLDEIYSNKAFTMITRFHNRSE